MMRKIYTILWMAISTLIIAISFTGCSETPIFYTIENETLVEDGDLDNRTTFTNMVIFDTAYYVGSGKKLWYRGKTSGSWSTLSLPNGFNDATSGVSSMALVGTTLYVSMYTEPQGTFAIYSKTSISGGWTKLTDNATKNSSTDYSLYNLFASGTSLYINRVEYDIYDDFGHENIIASKVFKNDFSTAVTVNSRTDLSESDGISGVIMGMTSRSLIYNVADSDGNLDGILCTGATDSVLFDKDTSTPSSDDQYYAIGEGPTYTFLSVKDNDTTNPLYYQTIGGGSWTQISGFPEDDALISCFYSINSISSNIVIAGTTDYVTESSLYYADGYYEINTSATPSIGDNSFSDSSNYTTTDDDLRYATINGFLIDGEILFAYTYTHGVWRNKLDGTTRTWVWE